MMNRTRELQEIKSAVITAIETHEKLKSAYFWRPAGTASGRRSNEYRNSFKYENSTYGISIENDYTESCKNVYYKGYFYLAGKRVTVAGLKKLADALEAVC